MKDDTSNEGALQTPGRSTPYPVSRLSPPIDLVDLAKEIEMADNMLSTKVGAQLSVIAEQIRDLQEQARTILEKAQEDKKLHRALCSFQKRPGQGVPSLRRRKGRPLLFTAFPHGMAGQTAAPFSGQLQAGS